MKLHPFTLAFRDEWQPLEPEYARFHFQKFLLLQRIAILIAIFFYAFFGILDAYIVPAKKQLFWFIRYVVVCPYALLTFGFTFTRYFRRYADLSLFLMFLVAGFGIEVMILTADPPATYSYYTGVLLVLIYLYTFIRIGFVWAFSASWLMILFYEVVAVWLVDTPTAVLVNNNFFMVVGNIFSMLGGYSIEWSLRRAFFLNHMLDREKKIVSRRNSELKNRVKRQRLAEKALLGKNREIERIVADRTAQLHDSHEKFRDLVERINDLIYAIDASGIITYVSPVARQMLGFKTSAIIGRPFSEFIHPDDLANVNRQFQEDLAGRTAPIEFRVRTHSGAYRWAEASSRPEAASGKSMGLRGVLRDISEFKKLEEQLRHALKMEAVGTLAGGVAHDFNNLLMGIQGRISLMALAIETTHPLSEHVEAIEEHVRSAAELAKQLLGFAQGGKYEVQPVDMNALVDKMILMFGRTRKEIQIHTHLDPDGCVVEVDRRQIEQALLNILINAWQAMPQGGTLHLTTRSVVLNEADCKPFKVKPGRFVQVAIRDTGIGMDQTTRQQIFDPFFTTKEKGHGTGLGMASAYGIVKNHGGLITVSSKVGQGTTFHVHLPQSDKTILPEVAVQQSVIRGTETVLLVDDEEMVVTVGRAMLEALGYQVLVAGNGQEALDLMMEKGQAVDLVLLDLIMPGMDGEAAFGKIRQIDPGIPVILSSGYALDGQARLLMEKGCNGFIQKPFTISGLSRKIRTVLNAAVPYP